MTNTSWQQQFKNQIKDAEALYQNAVAEGSFDGTLLFYCLKKGVLTSEEYLDWARETHQIAVLSESFFTKHPPTLEVFAKYRSKFLWTEQCLPIAEWEGQPIVACLEIPTDYSGQAIFLLTAYENLESTWSTWTASTAIGSLEAPEEIDLSAMTAIGDSPQDSSDHLINTDGELKLQDEEDKEDEAAQEMALSEDSGVSPEGFLKDVSDTGSSVPLSINNNFVGITLKPLTPPPIPENTHSIDTAVVMEVSMQEPSMLHLLEVPANEAAAIKAILPKAAIDLISTSVELHPVLVDENSALTAQKPRTNPPQKEHDSGLVTIQEMVKKGPRTSRPLALDSLPLDDDQIVETDTQKRVLSAFATAEDLPKAPMKRTQTPIVGAAAYLLEKIRKAQPEKFDKEVIACFNQCKTFFKKSMLLAIGDKDRVVKPILWEGGDFDIKKPSMVEFSLRIPSIFRVVSGTQRPYHGYVVTNDLNEAFFEAWNHGQVPDHVTIVPLMDNDLVIGMLMGFGEKACYNKSVLNFSENAAKELSRKILKSHIRAA